MPNSAPVATFWRTVMEAKICGIWKVRAMPSRQQRFGGSPRMFCPSKLICPAEVGNTPVQTLSSVVLPAPLGPATPSISPRSMSKLTPSSARNAPNRRTTPSSDMSAPVLVDGAEAGCDIRRSWQVETRRRGR
jgi:hypothetical protein